jgi:Protein of unknown function (DUF2877)
VSRVVYAAARVNGRYQARLVSTALPTRAVGRVHSVFRAAVNLEFEGELVTLAGPAVGGLPNGIVLDADLDFSALGLVAGRLARLEPDTLCVDGRRLVVDLRTARPWSPRLARGALLALGLDHDQGAGPLPASGVDRNQVVGALAAALARVPVHGGFAPLLRLLAHGVDWPIDGLPRTCAMAYPAIRRLRAGAVAGELDLAVDGARGLIGLGEGLTPSGDDLLVGFSAGLRAVGSALDPRLAQACAQLASGRTTRIAEAFLVHAARGEYSARLHRLVQALSAEPHSVPAGGAAAAELPRAPRAAWGGLSLSDDFSEVLGWGASSGADTLLGLLLGGGVLT